MRYKVMVSAPYMRPVLGRFEDWFSQHGIDVVCPRVDERLSEAELLEYVAELDGAVCGDDAFTERVFANAPRLKVISKWGTGIDSIDLEAAARKGVHVLRTSGAFTDPVADSVLGYVLSFARTIPWATQDLRCGGWEKRPGRALSESVLGIVGVGDIGRAVAQRALAFGMRVLGTDPRRPPADWIAEHPVTLTSFEELMSASDYVSLNCDLNPTSQHLVDAAALSRMKKTSVLINTARGPVVHESDLIGALERGVIAGAALDVFELEPLPHESPLRRMENVLLSAHNSNSSPAAWERVHRRTLANLLEGLTHPLR